MNKRYRRNVAAIVINSEGKVLACERSDVAGAWQIPQGGIEDGEDPQDALVRELEEEIGTSDVEIIGSLPAPLRYDWPEHLFKRGYHGQEQNYFLVRLNPNAKIDLSASPEHIEFAACCWMSVSEFISCISGFKAEAYKEALRQFADLFPDTLKE